jgi:hypothetical protein
MSLRFVAGPVLAAVLFGSVLYAEEPLKSGPAVGARNNRSGFVPKYVSGPGQPRCPV